MKIEYKRAPDSAWFAYWKSNDATRDLGDYVIWICGWEIKLFKGDNPWK